MPRVWTQIRDFSKNPQRQTRRQCLAQFLATLQPERIGLAANDDGLCHLAHRIADDDTLQLRYRASTIVAGATEHRVGQQTAGCQVLIGIKRAGKEIGEAAR